MLSFSSIIPILIDLVKSSESNISTIDKDITSLFGKELDLLASQEVYPHFFFKERDGYNVQIAIGSHRVFKKPKEVYKHLKDGQKVFGVYGFKSDKPLPKNFFFLPVININIKKDKTSVHVNIDKNKEKTIDVLKRIKTSFTDLELPKYKVLEKEHTPKYEIWGKNINTVLDYINKGFLKKVVLARKTTLTLSKEVSSKALLKKSCLYNKDSFHYLIAIDKDKTFIGSSPELLYKRNNKELYTEALAGTIGRDKDISKDDRLSDWLINSNKNRVENQYVVDDILTSIKEITKCISISDDISLIKLRNVQHLKRDIKARLKDNIKGVKVLKALQPTAAVAGLPRNKAIQFIKDIESFKRGWYSGSIGYFGHNKALFSVALRAAMINKNKISLYSGAGIVKGSKVESEWQELDKKMATIERLITER